MAVFEDITTIMRSAFASEIQESYDVFLAAEHSERVPALLRFHKALMQVPDHELARVFAPPHMDKEHEELVDYYINGFIGTETRELFADMLSSPLMNKKSHFQNIQNEVVEELFEEQMKAENEQDAEKIGLLETVCVDAFYGKDAHLDEQLMEEVQAAKLREERGEHTFLTMSQYLHNLLEQEIRWASRGVGLDSLLKEGRHELLVQQLYDALLQSPVIQQIVAIDSSLQETLLQTVRQHVELAILDKTLLKSKEEMPVKSQAEKEEVTFLSKLITQLASKVMVSFKEKEFQREKGDVYEGKKSAFQKDEDATQSFQEKVGKKNVLETDNETSLSSNVSNATMSQSKKDITPEGIKREQEEKKQQPIQKGKD